jgi:hypothetical protein
MVIKDKNILKSNIKVISDILEAVMLKWTQLAWHTY